tara:strand:- start:240 stop:545 length:306 start_codon:yes stop_codon:yes gene_type:complete
VYALRFHTPTLPTKSKFTVAITAVNRPITARFKRYFGVLAALATSHGEHLASGHETASETLCLPCLAALRTALWLINIAFGLEKLLFLNAESESCPTIGAL